MPINKQAKEMADFALNKLNKDRLELFKLDTQNEQIAVQSVLSMSQATISNNKILTELVEKYNITNIILMVILIINIITIGIYLIK